MCGSCEHDFSPALTFSREIVDKRFAIRKRFRSKVGMLCHLSLKRGAAAREPKRQAQQACRLFPDDRYYGLDQSIRNRQCAIEINDKRKLSNFSHLYTIIIN